MRLLAADYAFAFDRLSSFYPGNPMRDDAWRDVIARAHAVPRATPGLAAILRAQLLARQAPPE